MKQPNANLALLSEHTHVLLHLYEHPESTVRELAKALDASERQTFRWLSDLQQAGYLMRRKRGRRNSYRLNVEAPLEESEARITLADFLAVLAQDRSDGHSAAERLEANRPGPSVVAYSARRPVAGRRPR